MSRIRKFLAEQWMVIVLLGSFLLPAVVTIALTGPLWAVVLATGLGSFGAGFVLALGLATGAIG